MVTAPPVLKYYEREKDLVIQCYASDGVLESHYCRMVDR